MTWIDGLDSDVVCFVLLCVVVLLFSVGSQYCLPKVGILVGLCLHLFNDCNPLSLVCTSWKLFARYYTPKNTKDIWKFRTGIRP